MASSVESAGTVGAPSIPVYDNSARLELKKKIEDHNSRRVTREIHDMEASYLGRVKGVRSRLEGKRKSLLDDQDSAGK